MLGHRFILRLALAGPFLLGHSAGTPITVDFEQFSDSKDLSTQVPGLAFSNAAVITAGISLNEFEFPPKSGFNVTFDLSGPIELTFLSPTTRFGAYFTYLVPLQVQAFDLTDTLVATGNSAFASNLALSGEPGSTPNELVDITHLAGIKRVVITGDSLGGSFVADDLFYEAVPEPALLIPTLAAIAAIVISRRRRQIAEVSDR